MQHEREIIVQRPDKRPYGTRIRIHIQTPGALGGAEHCCVAFDSGPFLTIVPRDKAPWEGGRKYDVTFEGFATATDAEAAGSRLAQAFLWMAISTDRPLRLEYLSHHPAVVYERARPIGPGSRGDGEVYFPSTVVLKELQEAYASLDKPAQKLLLSMEIFCAARFDSSLRGTFLSVVSSLEPLADEKPLGPAVEEFIEEYIRRLLECPGIHGEARRSLEGRLQLLRKESIRQALLRLIRETLPDQPESVRQVDRAYNLRSQLIHDGVLADADIDLEAESRAISLTIRALYAALLNRRLVSI